MAALDCNSEDVDTSRKNYDLSDDVASLNSWTDALSPTAVNDEDYSILFDNAQRNNIQPDAQNPVIDDSVNDGNMATGQSTHRNDRYSPSGSTMILNPANLPGQLNVPGQNRLTTPTPRREEETHLKSAASYDRKSSSKTPTEKSEGPPAYDTVVPNNNIGRPNTVPRETGNVLGVQNQDQTNTSSNRNSYDGCDYSSRDSYHSDFHSWPSFESPSARTFPPLHSLPTIPIAHSNDSDQGEKMKNKFLSVWNNMKYGWTLKTKTTFRVDSPVWLLGKCYHIKPDDDYLQPGKKTKKPPSLEKFKQDFSSCLWFTYRQDFPQIPGTKLTTDCGWGCMLRSGQMMLARAFTNHYLGRDWNVLSNQTFAQETYRKQIIRWFGDFPCDESPFSMHRMVEVGKNIGKQPGDWFGPASVAHILKQTMVRAHKTQIVLSDMCLYVAQDCTVYKKDVEELCCKRPRSSTRFTSSTESESEDEQASVSGEWKRAVIILIPVRLGGEELNPVYTPCIKSLLAQDSCIGIIGGKPKHSLYFVGWQEEKLIYLDPHYCQDAVDTRERNFPVQTYHCLSPRKVHVNKMDPSCTIGFYCQNKAEFDKFVQQTEEMVSPPKQRLSYPMFVFSEGRGTDISCDSHSIEEDRLLRIRHVRPDPSGRGRSETIDSEEFVIL